MRRPLTPSQSLTTLDSLIRASSRNASTWFLEAHSFAHQLQPPACHQSPCTLFRLRYKAQHPFAGQPTPPQTFRIPEIVLASLGRPVGLRLWQMQLLQMRLPIQPHRLPVLARRFQDHFPDLVLLQPTHQMVP